MNRSKRGLFSKGPKVYDQLLKNQCVTDWIDGYDSHFTRDNFLRALRVFTQYTKMTPDELLKLAPQDAKQRLVALSRNTRDQDKSAWAFGITKSMRSFYRHHGIDLKLQMKERI